MTDPRDSQRRSWHAIGWLGLVLVGLLVPAAGRAVAQVNTLELLFTYGSEKESWITDVTKTFNQEGHLLKNGKRIQVKAVPLGSGESIDELLAGRRKAHLTSPASGAFIEMGNADSQAETGKDLIGPTKNLVLSPVIIAMWKPMAEALGWPKKQVGWSDIHALARHPRGWESLGPDYKQWGPFRFGHTHPEFSNSGLISLLAEVYAGAGKTDKLEMKDVKNPVVAQYLREIEQAVVHYGSSTGFFGKKMFANPPNYLNAAILYENMVIESYEEKYKDKLAFPLVALYPKEGTFWSDHPVGVVLRPWVTDEHRAAAKIYIDFLFARPQQQKAMRYGFRPGDESIALAAPLDREHGIDPGEPKQLLLVPPADVMRAILKLWRANKKQARVVLVIDTSGSMNQEQRLVQAKRGAAELVEKFGDRDTLSLLAFDSKLTWIKKDLSMNAQGKTTAKNAINSLLARGETALYDAIDAAYQHLLDNPRPEMMSAVVVLTDGEDNKSKLELKKLLGRIKIDNETKTIRVFTIAYGSDANQKVLRAIADVTQAKAYVSDPRSIFEVFKDIATFF
jgi:Ca-activated chloride channel family protein